MPITHAADHYPAGRGAMAVFETHWHVAHPGEPMPAPDDTAAASHAAPAFINDGRWVVTCPDCGETQVAARDDHRMLCFTCLNIGIGGRFRPVTFPHNIGAIEAELDSWPAGMRKRWIPGETVRDLGQRRLDNTRPSVPRLEDLAPPDAAKVAAAMQASVAPDKRPQVTGATSKGDHLAALREVLGLPVIEWADEERTVPRVTWSKKR